MQHICLLYARNTDKHFNCFILFNAHDNPIIVSILQMGLREIKHFTQDAGGTKIQSQADGPDSIFQILTVIYFLLRAKKNYTRGYKKNCRESKCQF